MGTQPSSYFLVLFGDLKLSSLSKSFVKMARRSTGLADLIYSGSPVWNIRPHLY